MRTDVHRPPRYIGATGFSQATEVSELLSEVPDSFEHKIMVGVLANQKTLAGFVQDQPLRYPPRETLGDIFVPHKKTINLVHWNTKEPERLVEDLSQTAELVGPLLHGFQLNMRWPEPRLLRAWRESGHPAQTIVLQCGKGALTDVKMRPQELIARLREYQGLIDYVLIDASGGTGTNFDPYFTRECFAEVGEAFPALGLGVAGNLKSSTLYNLSKVRSRFQDFSIDAESGLRNEDDTYSAKRARNYLTIAVTIFTMEKQQMMHNAKGTVSSSLIE